MMNPPAPVTMLPRPQQFIIAKDDKGITTKASLIVGSQSGPWGNKYYFGIPLNVIEDKDGDFKDLHQSSSIADNFHWQGREQLTRLNTNA